MRNVRNLRHKYAIMRYLKKKTIHWSDIFSPKSTFGTDQENIKQICPVYGHLD